MRDPDAGGQKTWEQDAGLKSVLAEEQSAQSSPL